MARASAENFTIPQLDLSNKLDKSIIQGWEQLWMMLNPTLNRSRPKGGIK